MPCRLEADSPKILNRAGGLNVVFNDAWICAKKLLANRQNGTAAFTKLTNSLSISKGKYELRPTHQYTMNILKSIM
jgi:hypothetical protein